MANVFGLVQQALFFGFFLTLGLVVVCSASLLLFIPRPSSRIPATTRATIYTCAAIIPVVGAVLILFLAMLPSLLEILGISTDHCLGHQEGHIHFCLVHAHAVIDHWLIWLPALIYLGMMLTLGMTMLTDLLGISRFRQTLESFRSPIDGPNSTGAIILDTRTPLALSCGLFKPDIYLSTGLLDKLTAEEQHLIIGHEQAHGRRHDALRLWLARGLSLVYPAPVRHRLLQQLDLACEQACDNATLDNHHAPDTLAELLLKIEHLYQGFFPASHPLAPSLTGKGDMLEQRVRYLLLDKSLLPLRSVHICLLLVLLFVLLLPAHGVVHDSLEHFMTLFTPGHHL